MTPQEAVVYCQKLVDEGKDEPVFVLRAQDRFAPSTVASWAAMVGAVTSADNPKDIQRSHEKAIGAQMLVSKMQDFQREHGSKIPD